MWTCIALCCSDASWAQARRKELTLLQKERILKSTLLLVVEDPEGTVLSKKSSTRTFLILWC